MLHQLLAAKGAYSAPSTSSYIGYMILACLPLASWIAFYYAGKSLAQRVSVGKVAKAEIILVALIITSGYLLINNQTMNKHGARTASSDQSRSEQSIIPTNTPIKAIIINTPTSFISKSPTLSQFQNLDLYLSSAMRGRFRSDSTIDQHLTQVPEDLCVYVQFVFNDSWESPSLFGFTPYGEVNISQSDDNAGYHRLFAIYYVWNKYEIKTWDGEKNVRETIKDKTTYSLVSVVETKEYRSNPLNFPNLAWVRGVNPDYSHITDWRTVSAPCK